MADVIGLVPKVKIKSYSLFLNLIRPKNIPDTIKDA